MNKSLYCGFVVSYKCWLEAWWSYLGVLRPLLLMVSNMMHRH